MTPQKEKAAIVVLAVAGILALGIGFWKIGDNIKKPFLLKPLKSTSEKEATAFDLQTKDTDSDGLMDYDEMYLYNTSPYIEDSDSDGKPDGKEIADGTDPNCPEGADCDIEKTTSEISIGFDTPSSPDLGGVDTRSSEINVDLNNLSPEQIRDLLRASGIDEATLSQLDNAALMEIYKEALKATE